MSKRLFRQEHPVLLGFIILGVMTAVFWGGITFFLLSISKSCGVVFNHAAPSVGVIEVTGPIFTSEDTLADLREFRRDDNIRAIVLRVDSPGGVVGASQEIYEEVRATGAVKPVVASLGSIAASGGYYAALGAGKIVSNPGTLTGSIGVILKFANLEELFGKIGFKSQVVKSGEMKDIGSPDRPMSERERELLQEMIDGVHRQFVQVVSESRKLAEPDVLAIADGRILSGEQALKLGLVDRLGNLSDAARLAAELASMGTEDPPLVYPEKDEFSLSQLFSARAATWLQGLFPGGVPLLLYQWNSAR